jgi:hypothetical protein
MGSFVSLLPQAPRENFAQAFQQGELNQAQLNDLGQRGYLQQAQTQGVQLQNQQQQQALDAQRAINQAMQQNITHNPNGTASVDYNGVVNSLTQQGFGAHVPGLMSNVYGMQQKQAEVVKDRAQNEQIILETGAQAAQSATDQPSWERALPAIRSAAAVLGGDPSQIPQQFDPGVRNQYVAAGTKATDYATHAYQMSDLALKVSQGLPKQYDDVQSMVNNDLSQAQNQGQWTATLQKYGALAQLAKQQGSPYADQFASLVSSFPAQYSPENAQQALMSNVQAAARPKTEQEIRGNQVAPLYAASTPAQYQAALANLPQAVSSQLPSASQAFNADGTRNEQVLNRVRLFGESPEQQGMEAYRSSWNTIRQQNADTAQQRADTAQDRVDAYTNYLNGRGAPSGSSLTPGQAGVQNRFNQKEMDRLEAQEDQQRNQRDDLRNTIQNNTYIGTDGQVKQLPANSTAPYQARLRQVETGLQNTQFRKAQQFGINAPDPQATAKLAEGGSITAADGSVWQKRDGIAYLQSKTQAPPKGAAPPKPQAGNKPPQTYTEADVRAAAIKAGKTGQEVDWAVQQARQAHLIP